jgi:hypothetical protein
MKEKENKIESTIRQLLEEREAENVALKKLIAALHEEEMRRKAKKTNSGESSKIKTI